ncbi:ATP-binding cassette domain-containing protein [Schaalia sp. ZJ405]|uniref:ATP-binding cassette domain-containing protein n=1 Tax=Schaalia sp. ZJ405 TaxID=2709403 RepID=UPI001E32DC6F|nr:ABC transporter ATP-binding protein [Schaalia sp. ZJ405]
MLGGVVASISEAVGAYARIARIRTWSQELSANSPSRGLPTSGQALDVSLSHVDLTYPSSYEDRASQQKRVLTDVSISVSAGSFVALVGRSGAGKSSIFNVLEGFYIPDAGDVFIGDISLRKAPVTEWRKHFALVDQDAPVFAGSVRENLLFVNQDASDDELYAALRHARVYVGGEVAGLDMMLGEGGTGISGGERQRLALARAFLSEAPVILLDEATSNLDSITEQEVQDALFALRRNRTVIAIAHRLSTISAADKIFVIDEGRVLAEGRHLELMNSCDLYRELVESQAIAE